MICSVSWNLFPKTEIASVVTLLKTFKNESFSSQIFSLTVTYIYSDTLVIRYTGMASFGR